MIDGASADPGSDHLPRLHALLQEPDQQARMTVTDVSGLSHGQTVALGLFVAAWEVYQGIRVLLERRLAEEALMLSRTLLEAAARLMWFSLAPGELEHRALRYSWTSTKYARDVAEAARANGWDWAEEMFQARAEEMSGIRGEARNAGIGDEPEDFPTTRELLAELKQGRLDYLYARASQSIHSTAIGISARIRPAEREGDSNTILFTSLPDEVARMGIIAAESFISALVAASRLLPWGGWEKVEAFGEDFSRRAAILFSAITGKPISQEPIGPDGS